MSYKKLKIACVILASGKSQRFGGARSKLFYKVHGTPIIEITLKNITKYINKENIYITIPEKFTKNEKNLIVAIPPFIVATLIALIVVWILEKKIIGISKSN